MSEHWMQFKVENLIKEKVLSIGDGYRAKNSELSDDGLPFARAKNINQGFLFDGAECLDTSNLSKAKEKISQSGDVVFTSKGTVGRFAFVKENTRKFVYSPQLCYWRVLDKDVIEPRFLYFWMHGQEFLQQSNSVKGLTDMADYVSLGNQRRFEITIPPIEEQRRIAEILSTLDEKIELNLEMNRTLERIAQATFKHWFVDFQYPGFDGELADGLPKGWSNSTFGELFSFVVDNRGKTPPLSLDGYKLLESYQISCEKPFPDISNSEKQKYVSADIYESPKWFRAKHPKHLDILCATVGNGMPKWCFSPSKLNFGIAQNSVAFRTDENVASPYFVKCLMDTSEFIEKFNSRIVTTAQPSIKVGPLKDIPIVLPQKSIISEFDKIARPIYQRLEEMYYQTETLTQIRDSLLPKLMSGKIRVGE